MHRTALVAIACVALGPAACGSSDEALKAAPKPAVFGQSCSAPKPAAKTLPKMPSSFPTPDGVTYTQGSKAGPSTIVYGYYALDLTEAHAGWTDELKSAGYTITAEEQDPADAEVNFSGHSTTGQVRLQENCKGRSLVTVTIRPG